MHSAFRLTLYEHKYIDDDVKIMKIPPYITRPNPYSGTNKIVHCDNQDSDNQDKNAQQLRIVNGNIIRKSGLIARYVSLFNLDALDIFAAKFLNELE